MISITCNQCKAVLTIDDAFAGGVCRCQHCGTIQTVPAHFKGNASAAPPVSAAVKTQKSLFQNAGASPGFGGTAAPTSASGLDELAQVVASSGGLVGSGLTSGRLKSGDAAAGVASAPIAQAEEAVGQPIRFSPKRKIPMAALAGGGAVAAIAVVGIILFLVFHGTGGNGSDALSGTGTGGSVGGGTANFGGVTITSASVVYLLDRANSMRDDLDPIKAATYQSIKSLGPDRKFAVLLWNNGGDDTFFPQQGLRNATSDQVDQLQKSIEDVQATGSSTLGGALETAIARQPGAIVIVTAKNKFDDDDQSAINTAIDKASGKIKLYAIVVGKSGENNFLKAAVKGTGGQYKQLTDNDLRSLPQ